MKKQCPICDDLRTITLPYVMRSYVVMGLPSHVEETEVQSKTYPCPECSTPQNKVAIAQGCAEISTGYSALAQKASEGLAAKKAVEQLVDFLIRENVFTFKVKRRNDGLSIMCVAELGVVTDSFAGLRKSFVDTQVRDAVNAVTAKAITDIQVWGSESRYVDHKIEKRLAIEFVQAAAKKAIT